MKKKFKFAINDNTTMNEFDSDNEIEIKKNKIIDLKYKLDQNNEYILTSDSEFTLKRVSGWFIIKCILDFKCNTRYKGTIENHSVEINLWFFEYLHLKKFEIIKIMSKEEFKTQTLAATIAAIIGAIIGAILSYLFIC